MKNESDHRDHVEVTVAPEDRSPQAKHGAKPYVYAGIALAMLFAAVAAIIYLDSDIDNPRDRVAANSKTASQAIRLLDQEPCHRDAMFRLLLSFFKAQEMRAVASEIEQFENTCGSALPEARFLQLRALVSLSDFGPAIRVADALVTENRASPKAWAARAEVNEKTWATERGV